MIRKEKNNNNTANTFWGISGSGISTAMLKYSCINSNLKKIKLLTNDRYNIGVTKKLEVAAKVIGAEYFFSSSVNSINDYIMNNDNANIKLYIAKSNEISNILNTDSFLGRSNKIFVVSIFMITSSELLDLWKHDVADEYIVTFFDFFYILNKKVKIDIINILLKLNKNKTVWISEGADIPGQLLKTSNEFFSKLYLS